MTYFVLLIATLCIELAMNLPIGSLPFLMDKEGVARQLITMAMGAGMVTSVCTSIPIGALVDKLGRIATMKVALLVSLAALLGLAVTQGAVCSGVLMGFRAIALICFMTAQAAYVSVFVPKERSVSAVATMGIMGNLAVAMAPACGVWLFKHGYMREQFYWAMIVIVLGGIIVWFLPKEHDKKPEKTSAKRVFMQKEWIPSITFSVACALQGGVNGTLALLAFNDRGIENGAILFTSASLTTVLFRYFAGIAVEKWGARTMAFPTAIIQAIGCVIAATAHTSQAIMLAGICFGIGWAGVVPVILGLLFAESTEEVRGSAMGAFYFSFGLGGALGSAIATAATTWGGGYEQAIGVCAAAPLSALPLLFIKRSRQMTAAAAAPHPIPAPVEIAEAYIETAALDD